MRCKLMAAACAAFWVAIAPQGAAAESAECVAATPAARAKLPKDVREILSRAENCQHFAGEFNGDRSARDREINRKMTQLRCDRVESDIAALKVRYRDNARVLKRVGEFERGECFAY